MVRAGRVDDSDRGHRLRTSQRSSGATVVAANCRSQAFVAYLEHGRVTLLDYVVGQRTAAPTGRNLASVTASTSGVAPFCTRTRPRALPTARRAGPYPWPKGLLRIYCGKSSTLALVPARVVEIEIRPVTGGNRLTVRIDAHHVFDAVITRGRSRYSIDWARCQRNPKF